jgi:hypothetical protein
VKRIFAVLLLGVAIPALCQTPPVPPPNPGNIIEIDPVDQNALLKIQRDLLSTYNEANMYQQKMADLQKKANDLNTQLNAAIDKARTDKKVPKDAFFDQDKLHFVVPPKAPEVKKPATDKKD